MISSLNRTLGIMDVERMREVTTCLDSAFSD